MDDDLLEMINGAPERPFIARYWEYAVQISFGINAERWLQASVFDLQTKKLLMREEPVVKLL